MFKFLHYSSAPELIWRSFLTLKQNKIMNTDIDMDNNEMDDTTQSKEVTRSMFNELMESNSIGEAHELSEDEEYGFRISILGYRFNIYEFMLLVLKMKVAEMIELLNKKAPSLLKKFKPKEIIANQTKGIYPEIKSIKENKPARMQVKGVDRIRTARVRLSDAESQPKFESLLGDYIQSSCISIIFSDTGVGKSVLAGQIANSLSKGNEELLGQKSIGRPIKVLLIDTEISDVEFHNRYNKMDPSDYFYTATTLKLDKDGLDMDQFYTDIHHTKADVVIIDNITALSLNSATDIDVAISIMRNLLEIKNHLGIALIIIAHVPKIEPFSVLTINSLGGSKALSNFADSVISIGRVRESINHRYIKPIKLRNSAEKDEVLVIEIVNEPGNLHFRINGKAKERELIKKNIKNEDDNLELAKELKAEGKSFAEISKLTGIPVSTLHRKLKEK